MVLVLIPHRDGVYSSIHPKFGLGVVTDDATRAPRGYEMVYDSHAEAFWGEQGRLQTGLKMG